LSRQLNILTRFSSSLVNIHQFSHLQRCVAGNPGSGLG
jgi:hypothetical protein